MQRFSIIVPLLDDRRLFDDTLASVLRYRPAESQIIVPHDGTYDDPFNLGEEVEFVSTNQRSGLVELFNAAIGTATGDFIALLRPGIELANGWHDLVESKFDDGEVGSVSPIIVAPAHRQSIVAAGVNTGWGFNRIVVGSRARLAPRTFRRIAAVGPTSWAAFYRSSALNQIGLLGDQIDSHCLDVDVAMSLQRIGYRCELSPECVLTIERATLLERESSIPHGKSAQRGYRRYADPVNPERSLAKTVTLVAGELLMSAILPWKFRHALGRLGAWKLRGRDIDYADHLLDIANQRIRFDENQRDPIAGSLRVRTESGPARRAA